MTYECNKLVTEQIISLLIGIGLEVTRGETQQTIFLTIYRIHSSSLATFLSS